MELMIPPSRLDRPVDHETEHVLGPADAETRSIQLAEDDVVAVATDLGVNADFALGDSDALRRARARVEADVASSRASGVRLGSFAPGTDRRGAAERWHASIIARRCLCGS